MSAHRNTVTVTVTLSTAQIQQMSSDKSYRCMVYCAALEPITGFTRDTDIAFPHQVEVRVNDSAVTGLNLRGLKNKPGSTRPADITDKLKLVANYRNEISLTYAMTQKVCQPLGTAGLASDGPETGVRIHRQLCQN
jgi:E3 SUMO-protein ligase PIAS1